MGRLTYAHRFSCVGVSVAKIKALAGDASAIIVAVLTFGGLWGFWGVFFAIPLATVVQAVLKIWPKAVVVAVPERGVLYQVETLRADPRREMHTRGG